MITQWEFYKIYNAFNLHFTSEKYDIIKYKGKTNASIEKLSTRNDAYLFKVYADKVSKTSAAEICIANFMYGENDFLYKSFDDANAVKLEWLKKKESLTYTFQQDLRTVKDLVDKYKIQELFGRTKEGNHPPLMQILKKNLISYETIVMIDHVHPILNDWLLCVADDPYLKKLLIKVIKYKPFVVFDKEKVNTMFDDWMSRV